MAEQQQHPVTPPPELVQQWRNSWHPTRGEFGVYLSTQATHWGADQQLEADCEWLTDQCLHLDGSYLRSAMRPKPPSLKEQALAALDQVEADFNTCSFGDTIRRALEALPNG